MLKSAGAYQQLAAVQEVDSETLHILDQTATPAQAVIPTPNEVAS